MHSQGNKNQTHPDITLTINTVDIKAVYGGLVATEARPSDVFLLINQHSNSLKLVTIFIKMEELLLGIFEYLTQVIIKPSVHHQTSSQ